MTVEQDLLDADAHQFNWTISAEERELYKRLAAEVRRLAEPKFYMPAICDECGKLFDAGMPLPEGPG